VRIDDERDLHEQLEAAFEAITPQPAPIDGAVRRGRAIKVRRRVAVAAAAAVVVAIGVFAVPSLLHRPAAPGLAIQSGHYTVTVQAPGPHSAPGLIASGTIDGQRWQLTASKPGGGPGGQIVTTSGPAFGGDTASGPAPTVDSAVPVLFYPGLTGGNAQVQYGAVRADVTYVTVRLGNGTVLTLHPVAVDGVRAVAFAVPVGSGIVDATAYSRHGEIAAAIPFKAPGGMAAFGVWLKPGQHGLAPASGRIGSGAVNGSAWSVTAYVGPWGMCFQAGGIGTVPVGCVPTMPTTSDLDASLWSATGDGGSVAAGFASASAAWVIVNQPVGTTTKVWPVTVGGQKLFAVAVEGGSPNQLSWTDYDSSGAVVGSYPG
jgi:hypothetical protein